MRRVRGTKNVRPVPARFQNRGRNRRSTVLVFWLERPGRVVFTVLDASNGCRPLGSFAYRGRAGVNRVRYRGRVAGTPLPPGRYTLVPRVHSAGRTTQLERVTIQILAPGAAVPLWRRTALVPTGCRTASLPGLWPAAAFGAGFGGGASAFALGGSPDGLVSGPGTLELSGVKGAEATDTEAEDGDGPIAVDEEPDEAGAGIALPAPFGSDGDGPPPLVGAAVLMALGFAIMTLIVLLVHYVRGSWNP